MPRLPILDKLDQELKESNQELQVEIPKAIKTAREHGDLSENAEFKAAKERQMLLESRISLLQKRISDITSIDLNKIPNDRSGLGSTLYLRDLNTGEESQYHLVFPEEVNPDEKKLYFYQHPNTWWEKFSDVAKVEMFPWRSLSTRVQTKLIPDNKIGRKMLSVLFYLEDRFPNFFVKHFAYSMIIMHKY